ncbi:liprin-alpha-like [Anopheles maculipalpis]|uniref:liprin-alpha-like n=1 Tax=Anopheles maculipalpis TaxID=1496333 RepID=UPI002159764E|nr:liprin-alpha-like [Anopheles maculipalpis]
MNTSRKPRIELKNRATILLVVSQIKQYPCIWDEADENYRNTKARQDAWFTIARRVGVNVPLLRRKWRSLSSFYNRIRKEWDNKQAQCKGKRCERPSWFAYNEMEFLGSSKKTCRTRGKSNKYLILDEEETKASKERVVDDMVNSEEDLEEIEESYETTSERNYTEASCDYTLTYDLNAPLEEDTSATLYYEKSNANDEMEEETEVPLERRYRKEKRKTILLHELNEKLEKDLQQQTAKIQLQQIKIESLEKKLEQSERKLAKLLDTPKAGYDNIMSYEEQDTVEARVKKEYSTCVSETKISAVQIMSLQGVDEQCDPLCNATEMTNNGSSLETIRLMTNSLKRMESMMEKFADKLNRRYSGFGEFMVRELNAMDETTSIRLVNEITSILKKEGHNYRKNHAKTDSVKLS